MSIQDCYVNGYCETDMVFKVSHTLTGDAADHKASTHGLLLCNYYQLYMGSSDLTIRADELSKLYVAIDNNEVMLTTEGTIQEEYRFYAHRPTGVVIGLFDYRRKEARKGAYYAVEAFFIPHGSDKLEKARECMLGCKIIIGEQD